MANGQGYTGLTPHPVILGLTVGLEDPKKANLVAATQAALTAAARARLIAATPPGAEQAEEAKPDGLEEFSGPRRAEVVMFAGYLGPSVDNPEQPTSEQGNQTTWRFLYQDSSATNWLLVLEDAIVLHQRAPDKKAAFQLRDVIWVRADAPVRQGDQGESEPARFLIGSFTRAGDLHASLSDAGSLSPASGILCAPTPQCCGRHSL
jgi:hypothetical protein